MQPLEVRVGVALRSRTLGLETPAPFETFNEVGGNTHHHWADGSACCCPRLPTAEQTKGGDEALSRLWEQSRCDLLTTGHGRVSRA